MTIPTTVPPVVLAADGTSSSHGALRYAAQEAIERHADLRVVHVSPMAMPVPPLRAAVRSDLVPHALGVLERAADEIRRTTPGLSVSTVLAHGGPVPGIVKASSDAQLVVVGGETRHGAGRLLAGAITAGVASRAKCPAAVVADVWKPRAGSVGGGHAVVGLGSAADAHDLLGAAYAWASARGASLTVVHAWEMADSYLNRIEARTHADEREAQGAKVLDEALAEWRTEYPEVAVETRVVHGQAARVLLSAAENADLLIVCRAHDHRPVDHLGATVRALLLAGATPILVVPTVGAARPTSRPVLESSGGVVR